MKTILFIDHASVVGGAQLVLINYLKYLNKDRFRVLVATSNTANKATEGFEKYSDGIFKIQIYRLKSFSPLSLLRFAVSVIQTVGIIRREHVDIVATNTERAMYVGTAASVLSGRKTIWFIRDFCYNKTLLKTLSAFPKEIICVSTAIKDFYALKGAKVMHVSSDMPERFSTVTSNAIKLFKNKFKLNNKFVVGYIGRLVEWKGINVLEEAVAKVNNPSIVCLVVGEGDKLQKNKVQERKVTGIKHSIKSNSANIVYTGFRDDIEVVLSVLDIFVHPAIEPEPYATTIVEAMMAKVPVIATNLGGTKEIIKNKVNGLLVKPKDSKDIAEAIISLQNDPTLRGKIGLEGYRTVAKANRLQTEINKLEGIFEDC